MAGSKTATTLWGIIKQNWTQVMLLASLLVGVGAVRAQYTAMHRDVEDLKQSHPDVLARQVEVNTKRMEQLEQFSRENHGLLLQLDKKLDLQGADIGRIKTDVAEVRAKVK